MSFSNDKKYLYKKIFDSIGEAKLYEKMKQKGLLSAIEKRQYPDIAVIADESINDTKLKDSLKKLIITKLRQSKHASKNFKYAISINTFFTTFISLTHCLSNTPDLNNIWFQNFAKKVVTIFNEDFEEIISILYLVVDEAIIKFTDIQNQLIYFKFDFETDIDGKPLRKIIIKATS